MKNIKKKLKVVTMGGFLLGVAGCSLSNVASETASDEVVSNTLTYPIVDTNQSKFFSNEEIISRPSKGDAFYGQDAQYEGNQPSYTDNGDGTISDNITGLMWEKSYSAMTYPEALEKLEELNKSSEYSDWRLPSIKELYSVMDFSGIDPIPTKAKEGGTEIVPFIDTEYFDFEYGSNGRRPVDTQLLSSTIYVGKTMGGADTIFGLNVADGRIKGYGAKLGDRDKEFTVRFVRGNKEYGINDFVDNSDKTVTDNATGLMWAQEDSVRTMNWEEALAWAQKMNEENYLGYSDWRVPNAKELHSILDYSRSPQTTDSAAIDELFDSTKVTIEEANVDYGFYWTSTTHESPAGGDAAVYVAFGEALGYFNTAKNPEAGDNSGDKELVDVHGAGSQRSDPKTGDAGDYPEGDGPQGDVVRIDNLVRLVRDAE